MSGGEFLFNQGPFRLLVRWADVTHAGQQARTVTGYRQLDRKPLSEDTVRDMARFAGWSWPMFNDAVMDELRR